MHNSIRPAHCSCNFEIEIFDPSSSDTKLTGGAREAVAQASIAVERVIFFLECCCFDFHANLDSRWFYHRLIA
ncbi:unnamed protein product [Victoria cruziana]